MVMSTFSFFDVGNGNQAISHPEPII